MKGIEKREIIYLERHWVFSNQVFRILKSQFQQHIQLNKNSTYKNINT